MKSPEHRAVGEAATGDALVQVGGDSPEQRCVLSYGDVMALSGDFFTSHHAGAHGVDRTRIGPEDRTSDDLFQLAAIPGKQGNMPGSRDEIICALKVMAVDGGFVDTRFEPAGQFGNHTQFSHFGSAVIAYRRLHETALDEACRLGRCRGDQSRAMAWEAAAQHYLTDAFAAGHLRTPVTAIRCFWHHRYPRFWQSLQRKVAADTASALRELIRPVRILPDGFLHDRALAAVKARTRTYPPITLGDLVARVLHDWDNSHGLLLDGGGILFGDGLLEAGVGKQLAVAAVRAGIVDIEVAYRLGTSGSRLYGQALYQVVRSALGAPHDTFKPEACIPIPSPTILRRTGGQRTSRNYGVLPSLAPRAPPWAWRSKRHRARERRSPAGWIVWK